MSAQFRTYAGPMSDAPVTQYARSADGTNLAYQVSGDGPLDLVFMPGLAVPVDLMWDDPGLIRMRKRLGAFTRTIWFEPRGWGASEGNPVDPTGGELFGDDLTAVLDAVRVERVVLVGASVSGPDAIDFSVRYPERVNAVVLLSTYAHYVRHNDYPWGVPAQALDRFVATVTAMWGTGDNLEWLVPSRIADDRFRQWWTRCERLGLGPDQIGEVVLASFERDVRALLAALHVPALVLHAQGDRLIHVGAGRFLAEHIEGAKFVALPGDDHAFFVGDGDALLDEIEEFLTGRHQPPEGDVALATILFTDIVDSTPQTARLGPRAWSKLTDDHDALVRAALQRHHGREVKTIGDGFLATFNGGAHAVRCAVEIVVGAKTMGLDVRAGLHAGEIELRGDDIAGLAVTIAKRVCDLAGPTQVLVSETMRGLLAGSGIAISDQGNRVLKGVPEEWRIYEATS
jgi:class 3 adenylate cyclase/pimeloyl-ACP methyl ester carboxylesterase